MYNTRNGRNSVTAEVILPKLNYVQGSGALRNTKLGLEPDNRLTPDELDLMVSERKDLQLHSSRSKENAVCKKSVPKNVQYAIEKALVYFKLINEEQVAEL